MSDNLKKATTEMIILSFLYKRNMHIFEITESFDALSGGNIKISYPYAAIYRLLNSGYIIECGKKIDSNRKRQYYSITIKGKEHLKKIKNQYTIFTEGINRIFNETYIAEEEND